MPALNFQSRFTEDIKYGTKRQTIRAHRKDKRPHCKVGDTLKLYTGMRTKACELIAVAKVKRIDTVLINETNMELNGTPLFACIHDRDGPITDNEFAQDDGFEDGFMEMAAWFEETHGLPFEGVVIYWDEPR